MLESNSSRSAASRRTFLAATLVGGATLTACGTADAEVQNIEEHGVAPEEFAESHEIVVDILLYDGMTALDAIGPYDLLNYVPNLTMRFVGLTAEPVLTDSGLLRLTPTHTTAEAQNADVLLVPGGPSAKSMTESRVLVDWVKQSASTATWVVSVCTGALILGSAGVLGGRPATTHWVAMKALTGFGAEPRPESRIVRSDNVVTAAGVSAGLDAALWLIGRWRGSAAAETAQLCIEYDPHPPFDSGHYSNAREATRTAAADLLSQALKR
ncbi:DJ-1/PfpI family protein [Saccharopolyspora indica]|uniref:DJ-1/PfpI family protein n=1 Tax=Saccharopolyspora indica TaxID=1229659 RepID=UPI0022EAA9F6|nr:DJ-1/PfpI family protein [Saccharopolyspora indica]MDA3642484.1 DJ-1/PfpI family protein [Saccharopolyspora indica]